jgi:hypothetical protein
MADRDGRLARDLHLQSSRWRQGRCCSACLRVSDSEADTNERLDWRGVGVATLTAGSLTLGVDRAERRGAPVGLRPGCDGRRTSPASRCSCWSRRARASMPACRLRCSARRASAD